MSAFTDKTGHAWTIELSAPVVRDVRDQLGINLTALDADPFSQLAADPVLLVDVLYVLCREEANKLGISSRDFGMRLGSDLDKPTEAVLDAIVNFFPAGKRSVVRSAYLANQESMRRADEILLRKIQDPQNQNRVAEANAKKMDAVLEKLLGNLEHTVTSPTGEWNSAT